MKSWLKTVSLPAASLGLLCALAALPGSAFAQTAAPAPMAPMPPQMAMPNPPAPAAEPPPQILGFDFTGYADAGYTSFSTGKGTFNNRGHARVFDWENGVASIQNVDLQLQKTPDAGFGGLIDLSIGKDADTIHSYGTVDQNKGPYFSDVSADPAHPKPAQSYFDATQLYAYYGFGSVNLLLGKYATHAGQEVIKSRDDSNFSRSILFGFAIPFTHTGVRATIKAGDTLSLLVGANEGWDTVSDANGGATGEFDWEWAPNKMFSFFGTYLNGQQRVAGYYPKATLDASPKATRQLVDLVFTVNASDALSFVLNYDSGSQDKVKDLASTSNGTKVGTWSGAALYANYTVNDDWRLSARGESFSDPDNYRLAVNLDPGKTKGATWSEGTVTVAYMGIKKTEIRAEVRSDSADQKIFSDAKGEKAINSMMSVGLEAIYKF
jgi:hypothetical protein